jgi:hypothetical protein
MKDRYYILVTSKIQDCLHHPTMCLFLLSVSLYLLFYIHVETNKLNINNKQNKH